MRRAGVAVAIVVAIALAIAALRGRHAAPAATRPHRTAADPGSAPRLRPRPAPPLRLSNATARQDARSSAGEFGGRVVSATDARPIAGAALTFLHEGAALSTQSDARGRFVVRASSPGAYELTSATAAGYSPFEPQLGHSPLTLWARAGVRLDGVTIYLSPALALVVVVQDDRAKPLVAAEVRAFDPDRGSADAAVVLTDGKGAAKITAQPFGLVEARKAGYVSARAWIERQAQASGQLTLRLAPGGARARLAISGHVVDRGGRPVDGALVEAFGSPGADGNGPSGAQTLSGVEGDFTLAPLDDTTYTLRAVTRSEGSVMRGGVRAGAGDVELRLGAATSVLRGTVRDAGGKPLTAFTVVAWPRQGVLGRGPRESATVIDAQGHYELPLPTGKYLVAAAARGFARSEDRTIDLGDDGATLDFTLRGGSRIFGRVVERDGGAPIAGADVVFEGASLEDGITLSMETISDADGAFGIDGVPPGRQSLNVQAAGHNGRILGALAVPAEGQLGPLTIDLAQTARGEEPRTEFVGIAAGIGARPEGMVITEIVPGGGAADAGLVAGDIILSIDGQSVAALGFVDAIQLIRGPEDTVVTLVIQRKDGSVQTIAVRRKRVNF